MRVERVLSAPGLRFGVRRYRVARVTTPTSTIAGHEAVRAAAKVVSSMLRKKLDRSDASDRGLCIISSTRQLQGIRALHFPLIQDDWTRKSVTGGDRAFGAGCFQAIRNPLGHLHNEDHEFTEQEAFERLAAPSLLARRIDQTELERADYPVRALNVTTWAEAGFGCGDG